MTRARPRSRYRRRSDLETGASAGTGIMGGPIGVVTTKDHITTVAVTTARAGMATTTVTATAVAAETADEPDPSRWGGLPAAMTQPPAHGMARLRRAIPVLLLLISATACAATANDAGTTSSPSSTASSTTSLSSPSTTVRGTATTIDAATALSEAVAATTANYRFESSFDVDGTALTTINGTVDEGSIAAEIATGTGKVSYIRTSEGEWITNADGSWVELDGEAPVAPPLTSLTDPTSLVAARSGAATEVTGVLGASAGNAAGITFTATVANGLVTEIVYRALVTGGEALVTTTITDVGAAGRVEPPQIG